MGKFLFRAIITNTWKEVFKVPSLSLHLHYAVVAVVVSVVDVDLIRGSLHVDHLDEARHLVVLGWQVLVGRVHCDWIWSRNLAWPEVLKVPLSARSVRNCGSALHVSSLNFCSKAHLTCSILEVHREGELFCPSLVAC